MVYIPGTIDPDSGPEDIEQALDLIFSAKTDDIWDLAVISGLSPFEIEESLENPSDALFASRELKNYIRDVKDFLRAYHQAVNSISARILLMDPRADRNEILFSYLMAPTLPRQAFNYRQN